MARIILNKTFRHWLDLWASLRDDLNSMLTELYYPNGLSAPLVTTPVGTVIVQEYGDGKDMTTILTLTDFIVGALAGTAAALAMGNIVAAFPAGVHIEDTFFQSLSLKCAGNAVNTDTGLGSVVGSGVQNLLSGVGTTSEDRLTGQTIPTAATGGAVTVALLRGNVAGISLNVTASIKNLFLNSAGTWNVNNTGNLTATGTIVIKWNKIA
jgi:hypothetical protein